MAIELPSEVAYFLNFIGVPWININEDKVREFATHVRTFASGLEQSRQDAHSTITQLGSSYSGASYEALVKMWAGKSTAHLTELEELCKVAASALDAGADFIVAQKVACIAELAVMAASFVADQAAAVATLGASEALMPVIIEGAEKLMEFAEQQLEQYIIGEVVNAALTPLLEKMTGMAEALAFKAEAGVLGVSADAAGPGFHVDMDAMEQHGELMRTHAQTVAGHAANFTSNLSGLDFES